MSCSNDGPLGEAALWVCSAPVSDKWMARPHISPGLILIQRNAWMERRKCWILVCTPASVHFARNKPVILHMRRVCERQALHAEYMKREVYLGSEEGEGAPLDARCFNIPSAPPLLLSSVHSYAWQVQVWALRCCCHWDQRLCQRRWSTANMQLSGLITCSGRARLLHPRRAPRILQSAPQAHTALCRPLWINSEKLTPWIRAESIRVDVDELMCGMPIGLSAFIKSLAF